MRDVQKSRVYTAEECLRQFSKPLPTVVDVETYLKRVWRSKRFRADYTSAWLGGPPRVKDGRGRRSGCAGYWSMSLPLFARNDWYALHELAHTVAMRERPQGRDLTWQAHGWQFASTYLRLVLLFMGREAHDALKASFKLHRVRTRPKRQPTPAQRYAGYRLLGYMRRKRAGYEAAAE